MKVKGHLRDLLAVVRLRSVRRARVRAAPATPEPEGAPNRQSRVLHPRSLRLVVREVRDESPTTRAYRLERPEGGPLPYFRAGQYLAVRVPVDGVVASRALSLCSAPDQALQEPGSYEVAVRRRPGGLVSAHILDTWASGTEVETTGPDGQFTVDRLRDGTHLVCLAGGVGITPFRSIALDALKYRPEVRLTLLYGFVDPEDAPFGDELAALAEQHPERLRVVRICSEEGTGWDGPTGLLTAEAIREHAGSLDDATVMVCGPQAMYRFLDQELPRLGLPRRRVRRELFGHPGDPSDREDFPTHARGATYELRVHLAGERHTIPAGSSEPVTVALERAGLAPPSLCRTGTCGFCRADLLQGEVYVLPETDGRRQADRDRGAFHPCASHPVSDLEIKVPRSPV